MHLTTKCLCVAVLVLLVGRCEADGVAACQSRGQEEAAMLQSAVNKPVSARKKSHLSDSEGNVHAQLKEGVVAKTKRLAEAMRSLQASSKESLEADFQEVLGMYEKDVAKDLGVAVTEQDEKKEDSLLDTATAQGTKLTKRTILQKTKTFAAAMQSLLTTSELALKTDFERVWGRYKDDLQKAVDGSDADGTHFTELAEESAAAEIKASVVQKTENLAKAMHSLQSSNTAELHKDFNEVMKEFRDDVASILPGSQEKAEDKESSLLDNEDSGKARLVSAKAEIVQASKDLQTAMESLETADEESLKSDLDGVTNAYLDDVHELLATHQGAQQEAKEEEGDDDDDDE